MENKLTQEWITQFNRKCSEFLEITYNGRRLESPIDSVESMLIQVNTMLGFDEGFVETINIDDYCQFHTDWNWIMEVVKAIEKLGYWVCIQNTYIGFGNKNDENVFLNYSFSSFRTTKKEAVVQAIDQFLDWYNKNKNGE